MPCPRPFAPSGPCGELYVPTQARMRRGAGLDKLCPALAVAWAMAAAPAAACRKLRREVRSKGQRGDSVFSVIGVLLLWGWKTADDKQQMISVFEKEGKSGN